MFKYFYFSLAIILALFSWQIAFLYLFASFFFYIAYYKSEWILYLYLFFYPAIAYLIVLPSPKLEIVEKFFGSTIEFPLVDLLAILALLTVFIQAYKNKKKVEFPALKYYLVFLFFVFLSVLFTDFNFYLSLKYFFRPIAFAYFVFFIPVYNLIDKKEILRKSLLIIYVLVLIASLMGTISLFSVFENVHRAHPIWGIWGENQNLLAELLVSSIIFSIIYYILYIYKKSKYQHYFIFSLFYAFLILLLTFSRTAWLSVFLVFLITLIFLWKEIKNYFWKYFIFVLLLLFPLLVKMYNYAFYSYTAQSSNWGRWEMTEFAYYLWKNNFYLGAGPGSFQSRLAQTPMYTANLGRAFDAHGLLQKVLSELGFLSLLALFIFFFYLALNLWKIYKQTTDLKNKIIVVLLASNFISAIFYQLFNTNYYSSKLWVPLALSLVFVKFYNKKEKKFIL